MMNDVCCCQVDIPTFVTGKVLNTAMRHLHTCLLATREATSPQQQQHTGVNSLLPASHSAALHAVYYYCYYHYHRRPHYTHTHTPFNGALSGTIRMSRYQKGKTNLDFTEARDSEWQWRQLGHMQVCTSLQTDNHTSTPPLKCFLQAG